MSEPYDLFDGRNALNILNAFALAAIFLLSACGPNRAEWMANAAKEQAVAQTRDLGNRDQVR
ncbi:MAG TPA: hypothetical protein VJ718_00160, partial [Candidatus Binataceae bacterium]|nr:hypothetical protein [Candidatus Binataceae bacterium]